MFNSEFEKDERNNQIPKVYIQMWQKLDFTKCYIIYRRVKFLTK